MLVACWLPLALLPCVPCLFALTPCPPAHFLSPPGLIPCPVTPLLQGDPSLLAALAAEPLVPGVRVTVPEDPALEQAAAGTAAAAAAKDSSPAGAAGAAVAATAGGAGRPTAGTGGRRAERPDDLLPDLLRLVQADPRQNKAKVGWASRLFFAGLLV
jgi:hypothetical protein